MKHLLYLPLLMAAAPAMAHHPLGGEPPQTLVHGLISGLAHPVIGIDHLAFIVLVGLAAVGAGRLIAGPAAFIGATMAGTALHLAGVELPLAEIVIALSVVALGALLVAGRTVSGTAALGGFALAGLFHGWAYGEAVIGSEPMPIVAYLAGFAAIQFAVAAGVARLAAEIATNPARALQARIAAAVCLGVGLTFAVEQLEGLILG